jgi:hypothetical protein
MTSGYGNHTPAGSTGSGGAKVGEAADPKAASAKPGAGSTGRPGTDLGGAGDLSTASGASSESHASPNSAGAAPHSGQKESSAPVLTDGDDDTATPGAGSLPTDPQGNEVDPGAG